MRVLVTGSRSWPNSLGEGEIVVRQAFHRLYMDSDKPEEFILVQGNCPKGPDAWAKALFANLAEQPGPAYEHTKFHIETYPAMWDTHGKSAGFKRNLQMVETKPDYALAFSHNNSAGTEHTIVQLTTHCIPHTVYRTYSY